MTTPRILCSLFFSNNAMNYHWNWAIFLTETPSGGSTYLGWMLDGMKATVALSLSAWIMALIVGLMMGVLRTVPNRWLSGLAAVYVEVFRNVPLLVQLFIWYFVLPELLPVSIGNAYKQLNPMLQQFMAAMICLGFFTGARVCEQVRSGINSLPRGQQSRRSGIGFYLAADLSLCVAANGDTHHPAATDFRVSQHLQEFRRGFNHRSDGTRRAESATE